MVATVELNNGLKIEQIGFGTWQSAPGEVKAAVEAALNAGYRHLDLAKVYQNQVSLRFPLPLEKRRKLTKNSYLFVAERSW